MLKSLMGVQFNERFWTFKCARSHEHHIYEEYSCLCISMWYHVSDIWNKCVLHSFTIVSPLDFASARHHFLQTTLHLYKKAKNSSSAKTWCWRCDWNSSSQNQKCLDCFTEATVYFRPNNLSVVDTLYVFVCCFLSVTCKYVTNYVYIYRYISIFSKKNGHHFAPKCCCCSFRSEVLAVGARCHPVEQLFLDDLQDQWLAARE